MTKVEAPNFLRLKAVSAGKKEGDNYVEIKCRLNPTQITSYIECFTENYKGEDVKRMTAIYCAGKVFVVDMLIEKVDEMMEDIDRSVSIKED